MNNYQKRHSADKIQVLILKLQKKLNKITMQEVDNLNLRLGCKLSNEKQETLRLLNKLYHLRAELMGWN